MENTETTDFISYDDNWLSMPFSDKWLETFDFVKNYISENISKNLASNMVDEIQAVLYTLVHDGDTNEDMVLKTALLYLLAKKTGYNIDLVKKDYDKFTFKGAKLLLDRENPDYLNNVFLNDDYAYLNKIKLAEYIVSLNRLKSSKDIVERTRKTKLIQHVIKTYEGKTHRGLMNMLKETLKSFN